MIHLNSMRNIGQNKEVKANEVDEEHYLNYDLKELNEVAQVDFLRDEDVVLVHVIPQYFIINRVALLELDVVIDELHEEFVAQVILKMPDADWFDEPEHFERLQLILEHAEWDEGDEVEEEALLDVLACYCLQRLVLRDARLVLLLNEEAQDDLDQKDGLDNDE